MLIEIPHDELVSTLARLQAENETMRDILDGQDYLTAAMAEINGLKKAKESLEKRLDAAMDEVRRLRAAARLQRVKT